MKINPKLTAAKLERAALRDEGIGFCIACAFEAEGCEPDARKYHCGHCGQMAVYGAEELCIMVM